MIKLLIGGSPCTHWSIAQTKDRETTASGIGWELFKNYLYAKERFKPDFFLYENNKSASQAIKSQISQELSVDLMYINSALVSAQNRQRFYAFNWCVEQPLDRGIQIKDAFGKDVVCLRYERTEEGKAVRKQYEAGLIHHGYHELCELHPRRDGKTNTLTTVLKDNPICERIDETDEKRLDGSLQLYQVESGIITVKGKSYKINLRDGLYTIRNLTVEECCRLQTLPDDYCKAVSKSQAYKGLGNGWTAEVIIHILNGALGKVDRHEKIVVLSMYDGIGTGRYCLDKMGFTNVEYYAYEIDDHAMRVASDNYPDIIQCGDAFALRNNDWTFESLRTSEKW